MSLGSSHDGVDARYQLVLVERLGHVVVGAEAGTFDFVLDTGEAGEDQDRRPHLRDAQLAQHVEARHIRKVQIEEDDVVVVDLAEIDAFLAEIGRINIEALGLQHQLDRLRGGAIVFNQQYAHPNSLSRNLRSETVPPTQLIMFEFYTAERTSFFERGCREGASPTPSATRSRRPAPTKRTQSARRCPLQPHVCFRESRHRSGAACPRPSTSPKASGTLAADR